MMIEQKKYNIIYADPPWQYSFSGTRQKKADDYPVMRREQIAALPVAEIAATDSILFLWMIWNRLGDALCVMDAWGFQYTGCAFTWVKRSRGAEGWHWGMGGWTRQNSENCLYGIKGSPERVCASVHSVIDYSVGEHSAKPPEVRDRIVQLMGDLPRIELFARKPEPSLFGDTMEGWDVAGYDISGKPIEQELEELINA